MRTNLEDPAETLRSDDGLREDGAAPQGPRGPGPGPKRPLAHQRAVLPKQGALRGGLCEGGSGMGGHGRSEGLRGFRGGLRWGSVASVQVDVASF